MALISRGAGNDNLLLVPDRIAAESLFRLSDALIFPRLAGRPRKYEKYFESMEGNKISIKRPFRAGIVQGRVSTSAIPMIDEVVEIYLDQRWHFPLKYNDEDLTLDIRDFSDRYLMTGCEELAYKYNVSGANEIGKALFYQFGTPGESATTQQALLTRAYMTEVAIPDNNMVYMVAGPREVANFSHDVKLIQLPNMVSTSIRHHYKGMMADMHLFGTNFIPHLKVPSQADYTPTIDASNSSIGGSTLRVKGIGNFPSQMFLEKGSQFTIEGVGEIHPRGDRQPTGRLAQWTATADVPANAAVVSVPVYPEINAGALTTMLGDGTTVVKQHFQTCDAVPATNAAVNVIGKVTADRDVEYSQILCFERSALEFVHVRLKKFKSAVWSSAKVDPRTMVAVTLTADFNIDQMDEKTRADIAFGVKTIYPEIGGRWTTSMLG